MRESGGKTDGLGHVLLSLGPRPVINDFVKKFNQTNHGDVSEGH